MTTEPTASRSTRPRVLFVSHDASSPHIAASLLREQTGDQVVVDTASTQPTDPGGRSDEMLVAMGLNPADQHRLSTRALFAADRVVVLDGDLDVARAPGARYEEWDIEHEDLIERVEALGSDLTAVPTVTPRLTILDRLRAFLETHRRR